MYSHHFSNNILSGSSGLRWTMPGIRIHWRAWSGIWFLARKPYDTWVSSWIIFPVWSTDTMESKEISQWTVHSSQLQTNTGGICWRTCYLPQIRWGISQTVLYRSQCCCCSKVHLVFMIFNYSPDNKMSCIMLEEVLNSSNVFGTSMNLTSRPGGGTRSEKWWGCAAGRWKLDPKRSREKWNLGPKRSNSVRIGSFNTTKDRFGVGGWEKIPQKDRARSCQSEKRGSKPRHICITHHIGSTPPQASRPPCGHVH